jgi:hypothetical protein
MYIKVFIVTLVVPLLIFYVLTFPKADLKAFSSQNNFYPSICSLKPADLVIPSALNPVLGKYSHKLRTILNTPENGDTPYLFLGYVCLVLAIIAVFKKATVSVSIPIFATGVIIFLLANGPKFLIYNYFSKLPFMSFIDCPQRFAIGIQLCVALLIGIFYSAVRSKSKYLTCALFLCIVGVFIIEYGSIGQNITHLSIPDVYTILSKESGTKTLLELPSGLTESKGGYGYDWSIYGINSMQMYWQTMHKKNKVGGYVSRIPRETYDYFRGTPIISDLFDY